MSVSIFQSTDASAPSLYGTAGTLITLLDAILVNGYGAKSSLGWTKAYSGTNKAAYLSPAGHYLRVDDSANQYARVVGYHSMTDVDTGTEAFPTSTQFSGGLYCYKSNTADGTQRAWVVYSDGNIFYLLIDAGSGFNNVHGMIFGAIVSYKTDDADCSIIVAGDGQYTGYSYVQFVNATAITSTETGNYISRKYDGVTASIACGKFAIYGHGYSGASGAGGTAYPEPINGGIIISPVAICESSINRGRLPGFWFIQQNCPFLAGDTFSGAAGSDLAGRTFRVFRIDSTTTSTGTATGAFAMETSDTWHDINFK